MGWRASKEATLAPKLQTSSKRRTEEADTSLVWTHRRSGAAALTCFYFSLAMWKILKGQKRQKLQKRRRLPMTSAVFGERRRQAYNSLPRACGAWFPEEFAHWELRLLP